MKIPASLFVHHACVRARVAVAVASDGIYAIGMCAARDMNRQCKIFYTLLPSLIVVQCGQDYLIFIDIPPFFDFAVKLPVIFVK